jgi:tetratricopeptide (TPR) repeat protein
MGDREKRRGRPKPPGPSPGGKVTDTGTALHPPSPDLLARLEAGAKTPEDGKPAFPEKEKKGRAAKGAKPPKPSKSRPAAAEDSTHNTNDTRPRIPVEEATDPNLITNLGELDVLEPESDGETDGGEPAVRMPAHPTETASTLIAPTAEFPKAHEPSPPSRPVAPALQDFAADPRFAPPSTLGPPQDVRKTLPSRPPERPSDPKVRLPSTPDIPSRPPGTPITRPPVDFAPPPPSAKAPPIAQVPSPLGEIPKVTLELPNLAVTMPALGAQFADAGDALLGPMIEDDAGNDNRAFEKHLQRYIEDFDDDENRVALELMAEKLNRWGEIVVEAKRHLARLTGTTGEDRVWAHLSIWNEHARGDREVPTSRSGELPIAAPIEPDLFGADYTVAGQSPMFDPAPLGEDGLFNWNPRARAMAEVDLEEVEPEEIDAELVPESGESTPDSLILVGDSSSSSIELIESEPSIRDFEEVVPETEGTAQNPFEDAGLTEVGLGPGIEHGPPTEAGMSRPTETGLTSPNARTPQTGVSPVSERPLDSRTLFVPMAPVPNPTEQELPLDASDLIDDDEPITPPPQGGRLSSSVSLKPEATVTAAKRDSRLAELRAEQEARAKERRASLEPPKPAPQLTPLPKAVLIPSIDADALQTGEFEAAIEKAPSDDERALLLVERARRELKKGQRDTAINSYRDALTFEPTNREAIEALEGLYRETKNTARLIEVLEQKLDLVKSDPLRVDGLVAIAEIYERDLNDMSGAMSRLEIALSIAPRNGPTLQALARCHEKLGNFAAQVEDLRKLLRGEASRSEKLELLLKIASIQEHKLDDPEGAVDTFEEVVTEHPQYKGAFDDLARLAEKSGSWKARAKLVEHQVELAKEPKRQAQLLVELGDLLAMPERSPEIARKHYERAARVFPSYAASWRGLEQLATWAGEPDRAEFFLEQRVRHTTDLVDRARVLIELAQYRDVVQNKHAEALVAYELAHKADPTNEIAAAALLSSFVAQQRYADAALLCDVLYRAALKADDKPRMLEILDTSWQVAVSMGNRGQLLAVAAARYKLAPDDQQLRLALLDTAYSARENEEALKRVRPALDLALERTTDDLDGLSQLGELYRAAGDDTTAENCFERVLLGNPMDPRALAFLSQRAEARNDFRRAASLKERQSREVRNDAERFDLLLCAGDLWLRAKGQVGAALRSYEEALAIKPQDQLLLRTLHGLYVDSEAWNRAAPVMRALADLEPEPDRKAKMLTSLAGVLEEQLDDIATAADTLEEVLELDHGRLDAFERLVRIMTRQKDWIGLSNAYRQMLGHLDEAKDPKLAYALHHQLGLVYRDRIGDAERALKSFTQAATLRPDDLEARKIVTELLVVTQRLDAAVDVARATLKKDPIDQQLYRDLYELFLRAHAYDKAWCVAEAMSVLGPLTDTERQFVEDYPPVDPSEIPASLLATAWPTHIHHADLDRTLSSALQIAVAVYLRARLQQAAAPPLGVPLEQDGSPEGARVLTAFRNAAEVLACTMPALHGTPVPGPLFTTVLAQVPTISISLATSSTVSNELLNFLATKRLAEQQPALRARSLFPSVQELKQLFFTTTQLATTGPTSMMRPGWDGGLGAVMTPDERAALRGLVAGVATSGQKLDVKRWLQLAEVTAMRAGLLVCGSVLTAQRAMGLEPRMPDDLGTQAWLAELGLYAVSEQYFELRETIHVAI